MIMIHGNFSTKSSWQQKYIYILQTTAKKDSFAKFISKFMACIKAKKREAVKRKKEKSDNFLLLPQNEEKISRHCPPPRRSSAICHYCRKERHPSLHEIRGLQKKLLFAIKNVLDRRFILEVC